MHATASSLIPLNSSRRAECNEQSPGFGTPLAGELSPFLTADSYRDATALSHIPFDSSRSPDSNGTLADSIRLMAVVLPSSLYFYSAGRYLQIVCCSVLQACHRFEPYTLLFLLFTGF